jgi:predicted Zn-dependent protease with MMP-like domain
VGTRRDRHGRALRGPLLPASAPAAGTRAEDFDDLVLDAFERLLPRWGEQLRRVEVAVQEVPQDSPSPDPVADPVPLAEVQPAGPAGPARIVVFRRPVELRTGTRAERVALLDDLVVETVADLLGLTPEQIDPRYDD